MPTHRSIAQWIALALRTDSRQWSATARAAVSVRRPGFLQVNVAVMDAREARVLNREYRGRDYATNVLSFPYELAPGESQSGLLGDIVVCRPVVAREAKDQGKSVRDHWAHLLVHGTLHLLGYDHEAPREADRMEAIERQLLESIDIPDPYATG